MGHWEWQKGEFKLPSAEFAKVRQAVADADRSHKEKIFEQTQIFWKSLTPKQKSDHASYQAAMYSFISKVSQELSRGHYDERTDNFVSDIEHALYIPHSQKPKRVLAASMEMPTNRTTQFAGSGVSIEFDKAANTVTYAVYEDKSAVDRAHGAPILEALTNCIEKMRWTRGTGGRIWGDNEYAEDARREHGHAFDLTQTAYGPVGAEGWPMQTQPWKDPKGDTFRAGIVNGKYGVRGRVEKGVPAGGQFSSRNRPESNVSLSYRGR